MVSKEKTRIYRQRLKTSKCRKMPKPACNAKATCKYANGKKRQFCRTKYNTRSNNAKSRSSKYTSSTPGSYPVLNIQELGKKMNPFRLQPVANRKKVNNERGLDDWGSSSSNSFKQKPRLQPVKCLQLASTLTLPWASWGNKCRLYFSFVC